MIWSSVLVFLLAAPSILASPYENPNKEGIVQPRMHARVHTHGHGHEQKRNDDIPSVYHQATREEVVKSLTRPKRSPARRALISAVPPPNTVVYSGTTYTLFYSGSGFIENDNNPSNTYGSATQTYTAKSQIYPGTVTQTYALNSCAAFARNPDYYFAFQLYYRSDTDNWTCRIYYHLGRGGPADSNPTYFNVPLAAAGPVFGYQVKS